MISCDILIAGGGTGGCAAALAAAEAGCKVCLLEEDIWLGGQLTSQGVPTPDEHHHIELFGGTKRYYAFRNAVRNYYHDNFELTPEANELILESPVDSFRHEDQPHLNPGNCWVSRISYEPKIGESLIREMLRPYVESGNLRIFTETTVLKCIMTGENQETVQSVVAETKSGERLEFEPKTVLDATELGDLLALCGREGIDWTVGAESQANTGEPDAPLEARRDWVQPFTFPFAVEWSPETASSNFIEKLADYDFIKARQKFTIKHGAITGMFTGAMPWWKYRRILAHENFTDSRVPHDVIMINTAGNDYYGPNILGDTAGSAVDIKATLESARQTSLSYLYWLQNECPREETLASPPSPIVGREFGYPELRLRLDMFDTSDGCSRTPYVRESRRILSLRTIKEHEIVVKDFHGRLQRGSDPRAVYMADSAGVGFYALDIHPNGHGEPNAYVTTRPFQIPLGALIPVRWKNLLPACKNIGTTHLTNGAYRLHPIEWNIGESSALLAVFCLRNSVSAAEVRNSPDLLLQFQMHLLSQGIALHWLIDVPLLHPAFEAVQRLAGKVKVLFGEDDLLFRPDRPMDQATWTIWRRETGSDAPEFFEGTRAEAAMMIFANHSEIEQKNAA